MAWKPLNDRMSDLLLVLAGPILRRTDESSGTVWVALKKPATVTLEVLEPGGVGPPRAWLCRRGGRGRIRGLPSTTGAKTP